MPDLEQSETAAPGLPVAMSAAAPRPSLARSAPNAAFVSQLLAARDRQAPQRARRAVTPEGAAGAYGRGARMGERRMPMGYRKTLLV
ncbi:MAG: hypothetical protein ABS76_18025 [Pelagibacterium sp. SCN 64-44]|nr:MAG: hypothetical protein ABS76_18025 [Pelagibacterium sp. SCN 64-44]